MVLFPNCKINLGLHVVGKRPDGYHNLETIFYPIDLNDAAEILSSPPSRKDKSPEFELSLSGAPVPGEISSNLCTRAWQLIKNDFPEIPHVKMHLLKAIPAGAGLGGGSSNGAFTLRMLNDVLKLNLTKEQLLQYALALGSDCPFFIINKPSYATGRGEILNEIDVNLNGHFFVLVNAGVHVNTAWAFSKLSETKNTNIKKSLPEIISEPVTTWKDALVNDFEKAVFAEHPSLNEIKTELYEVGAEYASMTGTGSCIYGIFNKKIIEENLKFNDQYKVYISNGIS